MTDKDDAVAAKQGPKPVAWMAGNGHPRHISSFATATEERLYGKLTPLYDQATLDAAVAAERERWQAKLSAGIDKLFLLREFCAVRSGNDYRHIESEVHSLIHSLRANV